MPLKFARLLAEMTSFHVVQWWNHQSIGCGTGIFQSLRCVAWAAGGQRPRRQIQIESTAVHRWVVGSCGALSKGDEENWQQQSRWFSIIQSLDRRLPAASERICKCLNQLIIAKGPKERFWVQKGNDNRGGNRGEVQKLNGTKMNLLFALAMSIITWTERCQVMS